MPTATLANTDIVELSALYDRIYDIADRLFKKHNPCNIHIECKKLRCIEHHKDRSYNTDRLCCGGCGDFPEKYEDHWSKTGCTIKCLACKLYLCPSVFQQNKRLDRQLYRLRKFAAKQGLPAWTHYFVSKEEWLKRVFNYE